MKHEKKKNKVLFEGLAAYYQETMGVYSNVFMILDWVYLQNVPKYIHKALKSLHY